MVELEIEFSKDIKMTMGIYNILHSAEIKMKGEIMKKIFGLCSLAAINCSVLYLICLYVSIVCSIKVDNILHIPYEPSGMQLFYYFISFPFFIILMFLSQLHSYYFNLRKSLSLGIIITWFSYFILIVYVDMVIHFSPQGNNLLYYGSLIISFVAIFFVIYSTVIPPKNN